MPLVVISLDSMNNERDTMCDPNRLITDGTVTGEDLYDVTQGFKFIAADTIDEDTAFIKIMVWIPGGGGAGKTKNIRRNEYIVCEYGEGMIIRDECGKNLPNCTINPALPAIVVNRVEDGFDGINICSTDPLHPQGITHPIFPSESENYVVSFEVNPCFDEEKKYWRYSVSELKVNVILDYCPNNFGNTTPIEKVSEVVGSKCCALIDFNNHWSYPIKVTRLGGYLLKPVIWAHEQQHLWDYQKLLFDYKSEFDKMISGVTPSCVSYPDIESARKYGEKFIKGCLESYLLYTIKLLWDSNFQGDKYEQENHSSGFVRIILQGMIDELNAGDCSGQRTCN